eukprot:14041130-Heterocapsa_arctica.AAC.1
MSNKETKHKETHQATFITKPNIHVMLGHLTRREENDPMKRITVHTDGSRVKADFGRGPRVKWYDTTKTYTIAKLTQNNSSPANGKNHMRKEELNRIIVEAAQNRCC